MMADDTECTSTSRVDTETVIVPESERIQLVRFLRAACVSSVCTSRFSVVGWFALSVFLKFVVSSADPLAVAPCMAAAKQAKLEREAARNWDLVAVPHPVKVRNCHQFYKRNGDRFFKDRHWTLAEFAQMCPDVDFSTINHCLSAKAALYTQRGGVLLEAGCGCGNLLFPLLAELPRCWRALACDFSPRAVELLKRAAAELDLKDRCTGFVCDLTVPQSLADVMPTGHCCEVDMATLVFVLSAVSPDKMEEVVKNMWSALRPGGSVLVRDYALNDFAMRRFGKGSKIADRFYARQDGTRAYYFSTDELRALFERAGNWQCAQSVYVHRRTVNVKEGKDVPRVFVQARFVKL